MLETNFSALDWAIVGAYLVGTVIIGLWVNRYIWSARYLCFYRWAKRHSKNVQFSFK